MTGSNRRNFHFLVFSSEPNNFHVLKNELDGRYSELVDFNAFSISPEVQEIFGTNNNFSVLLRPDNHVGFISSDISSGSVQDYPGILQRPWRAIYSPGRTYAARGIVLVLHLRCHPYQSTLRRNLHDYECRRWRFVDLSRSRVDHRACSPDGNAVTAFQTGSVEHYTLD